MIRPYNLFAYPKAIPGSIVTYTITVTNPTGAATDADSVTVTDMIPVNTKLIATDYGVAGSGPVADVDGASSSGLAYSFVSLASTTDGLQLSNLAAPTPPTPRTGPARPSRGPMGSIPT